MRVFIAGFFMCFSICLQSVSVFAQLPIEEELMKPIRSALEENRELSMKLLSAEKTEYEKESVKAKRLPQISASGAYGYLHSSVDVDLPTVTLPITGNQLFSGTGSSNLSSQVGYAGLTAKQVLFSGLQIPNGLKALEEKYKAESFMAEADKGDVIKDVILTFDQLMLLNEVEQLIHDSEKRLQKEQQKVIRGLENGLAIPYDRDKLTLAILELNEKQVELDGNRELLYSKLKQITHLSEEELKELVYELQVMEIQEIPYSVDSRLELKALEHSSKAFEYNLKKEEGGKLPLAFAFGSANYLNFFDTRIHFKDLPVLGDKTVKNNHLRLAPNFFVGVGVKWDIFDGGNRRSKVNSAKLDLKINEQKTIETNEKLNLLLEKNRIDYFSSLKKIKVAEQQVKVAKNTVHLSNKRFEEGLSDITDFLAAENDLYKVKLNYYSQVLAQRSAAIDLYHTSGLLLNEITK